MNDSDEWWRGVHRRYVMSWIVKKMHSIGGVNCAYLAVTNNVWFNQRNDEWEWWSMKVVASKIWNESTTSLSLLLSLMFNWIDETMNGSDEVWRWVNPQYGINWIVIKLRDGYGQFVWLWLYTQPKSLTMMSVWQYCENLQKWKINIFWKNEHINCLTIFDVY